MKVAIVGSGAIGLYYGALMERSGHETHFLLRSGYEAAMAEGIAIETPEERFTVRPVRGHRSSESIGECDWVVVALKATSNATLAETLPPLVGSRTRLLTLQNGLGNDQLLSRLFPENKVFGGLCFVCLNRVGPARARNFMLGSVSIGPYATEDAAEACALAEAFRAAGVKTRFEADLRLAQWKKLVWNVPFNGLAVAAGGVTTDRIVESPELLAEARGLMAEIVAGAAALDMEISPDFVEGQVEVTVSMKAYRPSSMIDFVEGRPVEVEAIWGEPLRQAKAAGASMPKLEMLYALLKGLC